MMYEENNTCKINFPHNIIRLSAGLFFTTFMPEIVLVNQYDKPMIATVESLDLSPNSSEYSISSHSTYLLIFPEDFYSLVAFRCL
jgi:hypothetical protein